MRADRIIAVLAGLAVGFGVLLVTVDVADTDAADGSPPTSTTVAELVATSTSTSTTTTTTTFRPTATTSRPTTTAVRPTTTTTTTLPDRTAVGFVTFDPRCIGLDLGDDASMTASEDGRLDWVRERVVDEVTSQRELSESEKSDLAGAVEELDWTRCDQVVVRLESDDGENWLCPFGSLVETSGSLLKWTSGESICDDEPTSTGNSEQSVGGANETNEGPG